MSWSKITSSSTSLITSLESILQAGSHASLSLESPDLAELLTVARARQEHPHEALIPLLKNLLLSILTDYMAHVRPGKTARRERQDWFGVVLIGEQYLRPLDDPLPPAAVRQRLQQVSELVAIWSLPADVAAAIADEAQECSDQTWFRRRRSGLVLLAEAIEHWRGQPVRALMPGTSPQPPAEVPTLTPFFVDRPEVQMTLRDMLTTGPGVALVGLGGIGKTTLAVWWARAVAEQYPGGQLWLSADGPVAEVQQRLGRSLGVTLTGVTTTERAAQLRTLLAGQRLLLVLDNVWDDPELPHLQVAGPDSKILVTSRDYQVAARLQLPLFEVERLSIAASNQLLATWLGDGDYQAISRQLAGHPLALTLIAALIQSQQITLSELMVLWEAESGLLPLEQLGAYDTLTRCFDLSYQRLAEADQKRLAQLSCFQGMFDLAAVRAIWQLSSSEALAGLARLRRLVWLERIGPGYRLPGLVRDYARAQLEAQTDLADSTRRRHAVYFIRHYLDHPGVTEDTQTPVPALEEYWTEVVTGVRWATSYDPRLATIAVALAHTERPALLAAVGPALLTAMQAYEAVVSEPAELGLLKELRGQLYLIDGQFGEGQACLMQAARHWEELGARLTAGRVWAAVAATHLLLEDFSAAMSILQRLPALVRPDHPLSPAEQRAVYWLFYWLNLLCLPLIRQPEFPETEVAALVELAACFDQPVLLARALNLYRTWCTAEPRRHLPEYQAKGRALAVQAWQQWRQAGRPELADSEIGWSQYELSGRFSRRTAARFARRRSRTSPRLSQAQIKLVESSGQKWWLGANEAQRVAWLSRMLPRYLDARDCLAPPLTPGSRAWQWVEDIFSLGSVGPTGRRLGLVRTLPAGHPLTGPEWIVFTQQKILPLVGEKIQALLHGYRRALEPPAGVG